MSNTQLILLRVLSSTKTEIYYSQAAQIYVFCYLFAAQKNMLRVLNSTKTKIYYSQAAQICVLWYQLAVQNNIFMLSLAALNIYRMHLYNFFLIL